MEQAARKLFELTDLDDDGYITLDEFVPMGSNQTKLHAEKEIRWGFQRRTRQPLEPAQWTN